MTTRSSHSRRLFLTRTGSTIAGALAAPLVIPSSVLGRDGLLPPSKRVAMGFIGLGGQGTGHLLGGAWTYLAGGYTARPDVQIMAVCDVWRERRESARDRVNRHYADTRGQDHSKSCVACLDFREVLDRDDIDAVLIASPAHWHALMSIMAARAGKDIYCEKPTAVTIQESQAVADTVRRYGRVYQAGTQQRSEYNNRFRIACELVRNGRIGQLQSIYAYRDGGAIAWPTRFGPAQPIPPDLDWDLYLGPAPWIPYDGNTGAHRFDIGELNWGQHHYDIVQWGANADQTGPADLFLENGTSAYRYANGVVVHGRPHPSETVGMDGGVSFVGTDGRITVDRGNLISDPPDIVRAPIRPDDAHLYRAESHSGNFLECVRTRKQTICSADVAHRSASALLLGGIVKQLRRPLKWDPQLQEFPDDAEANRMRSIAQRPPWRL
jgi:hypothetical protein